MAVSKIWGVRLNPEIENRLRGFMKAKRLNNKSEAVKLILRQYFASEDYTTAKIDEIIKEISKFGITPERVFPELKRRVYLGREIFSRSLKDGKR